MLHNGHIDLKLLIVCFKMWKEVEAIKTKRVELQQKIRSL
jgi:hypothetical protein